MTKLSEVAASLERGSVRVGDADVSVRCLRYPEVRLLSRVAPLPEAPPASAAKAEQDAYRDARHAWDTRYELLEAAVAIDLAPEGSPAWDETLGLEDALAWAAAAEAEMRSLPFMAVRRILDKSRSLAAGAAEEQADGPDGEGALGK